MPLARFLNRGKRNSAFGARHRMDQQIFTDGIGRITVIGGVVRLDLVTYSPNETDAQGKPRQVFTQRVVMGAEAFLRSAEKVRDIVQQLSHASAPVQPQPAQPAPVPPQYVQRPAAPQKPMPPQPVPPQPIPKGEPPYVNGPLFPTPASTPDKPARAPFP
jgi:hypothetical protein